jgi:RND family efflux transporter MFP subunit
MLRTDCVDLSAKHLSPRGYGSWGQQLPFAALLLGVGVLLTAGCEKKQEAVVAAPPDVDVIQVEQRNVPIVKEWVATMNGFVNAQVRAQVTGILMKQLYNNGDFVKKGAPLFQIDPRAFQAALDQSKADVEQAKGKLQQSEADLGVAQAHLGKTKLDVDRNTPLAKVGAISRQELDDSVQANLAAQANVEAAKAAIEASKAAILASRAAVDTAQLNLGYTAVASPVDGVAGINNAQIGDLVGPTAGPLTTISTVDPILANFNPSEEEYLLTTRAGAGSGKDSDAFLRRLEFTLQLTDGTIYPHKGHIYSVDRNVDVKTGSILVQTQFPNQGNILRPGGFGRVSTVARNQDGALLVPQRAVTDSQGTYLVAVVGSDNKVSIKTVTIGATVGDKWIISQGLKPGDRVVAEGIQKVKQGMAVNPKPYSPPAPAAKPVG